MSTARLMTAIILQPSPSPSPRLPMPVPARREIRIRAQAQTPSRPSAEPDSGPRLCPVSWQASLGINKCKTSTPWAQNCYRHRGGYLVRPSVDFDIDIDSDSDTRRDAMWCGAVRCGSTRDSPLEIGIAIGAGIGIHSVVTPAQNEIVPNGSEQRERETRKIGDSSHGSCSC